LVPEHLESCITLVPEHLELCVISVPEHLPTMIFVEADFEAPPVQKLWVC